MDNRLKTGIIASIAGLVMGAVVALAAQESPPSGAPHVYKTVDGRALKLYVVSPANQSSPSAAIVFFHGGGWTGGRPTQFERHAARLAERGMVTIQPEYRLLPRGGNAPPTVCIQDAKSAMRWVRAHAAELKIDPRRLAAGGGSAGGHLAAFTGTVSGMDDPSDDLSISARPDALVLFNPVFDNGPGGYGYKTIGDRYREFSPLHNVSAATPPSIVFVGSEDPLVPAATVEKFCAAARAAKVRCDYHIYPGQKHGFFNYRAGTDNRYYAETMAETERFLGSLGWLR